MKQVVLIILFLAATAHVSVGQTKYKEITYHVSKPVADTIVSYLESKSEQDVSYYCRFSNWYDTSYILIVPYRPKSKSQVSKLAEMTNRILELSSSKKMPILFSSDFSFSGITNHRTGNNTFSSTDPGIGGFLVVVRGKWEVSELLYTREVY